MVRAHEARRRRRLAARAVRLRSLDGAPSLRCEDGRRVSTRLDAATAHRAHLSNWRAPVALTDPHSSPLDPRHGCSRPPSQAARQTLASSTAVAAFALGSFGADVLRKEAATRPALPGRTDRRDHTGASRSTPTARNPEPSPAGDRSIAPPSGAREPLRARWAGPGGKDAPSSPSCQRALRRLARPRVLKPRGQWPPTPANPPLDPAGRQKTPPRGISSAHRAGGRESDGRAHPTRRASTFSVVTIERCIVELDARLEVSR